ncbi:MAG: translocation/assembly module TamB domain-containing protein [Pyrinomonadaceae bacterium]
MQEEDLGQSSEETPAESPKARRRYVTRRNALLFGVGLAALIVVLGLLAVVLFRYGTVDSVIKGQFVDKMNYMGIDFTADVFSLSVTPLELTLKNATFTDRTSGENLGFIREGRIGLSIDNLFAWQTTRDIKVDSTEIWGAEVWVKYDENGRSNFANLVQDERASSISLKYDSVKFALRDSVVHFGDLRRTITADANNLQFFLDPESWEDPTTPRRYRLDLTSTGSTFTYQDSRLDNISLRAKAIADETGADISELRLETPIGEVVMNGRLADWKEFRYDLNIESSVDLTQTSTIFPLGATLRGVGNFKGKVIGSGENYSVDGRIESDALAAEGVYLKGINVAATVAGTNSSYEANGTAIAELLTFEDFRVEFPKLSGNVRGTGSDFRWVGELQAVAAKSKDLSIVGLFVSDAVAEYKDKQLMASGGSGRAQKFSISDTSFDNLSARGLTFSTKDGVTQLNSSSATAGAMTTPDYKLEGVQGRNLRVRDTNDRTTVELDGLVASGARLKDNRASNLRASRFELVDTASGTKVSLDNLTAARVDAAKARISGVSAPSISIEDDAVKTLVNADRLRIASIEGGGAVLGNLNIAGVRLTIRQGTVSGSSNDIDAGTVTLRGNELIDGGGKLENVQIKRPVFVVEPSGRYRASADMSIGGGTVGSIPLGNASAKVNVSNDRAELTELTAAVMNGTVNGTASIAFSERQQSRINADFVNLDLSKIVALQGGRVIPFEGSTTGRADITFNGTNIRSTSGAISADITANAGDGTRGTVPVNGRVEVTATNGLFNIDTARLNTTNSQLSAAGTFDLQGQNSNLDLALSSTDAAEIERLVRILGVSPDLEEQLDSLQVGVSGNLAFNGKLTGNLTDPTIDGKASLASLSLRGREVGSVSTDIFVSPAGTELRNGMLRESTGGGTIAFSVSAPAGGANNTSVQATLTNVNAGNILAALPVDLPERLRDFTGTTTGSVNLTGLPNASQGEINIASTSGTVAGQSFDSLRAKAVFSGTRIELQEGDIKIGEGFVSARGGYDRASSAFDFELNGKSVPLPLALAFLPENSAIPTIGGLADFTAKAIGEFDRPNTYNINFSGSGRDVVVNDNTFGVVEFQGTTTGQVLNADLTAILDGRPQVVSATVNFGNDNLPVRVEHVLDNSPLAPFFALVPQLRGIPLSGVGTGTVEFGGNLRQRNDKGELEFSTAGLTGTARFTRLDLQIQDTPLSAAEPVVIAFSPSEINFQSAKFSGGGSNLTISGVKALTDAGVNSLAVDGRVNLALLNAVPQIATSDTFFGGYATVAVRVSGVNSNARLSGTATMENAAVAAFIGSSRLTFDRLKGRILFASNQAQIDSAEGYLGGGKFTATGGVLFQDNLQIDSFRVALDGTNITVPLPEDFTTTGDARLEFSGRRVSENLRVQIAGNIRARRALYSRDIELANIVGGRSGGTISSGPSSLLAPRFDLTIEGRDALIVKNNIADLTASVSLRLTGTTDNPQISGRITANSGVLFFRRDRYDIQRGVLEFPPDTAIEPIINLQAETEIQGYQIFVNFNGSLAETETLALNARSSPALPSQDVLSLITTGNLSNTEAGLPGFATTGINTAAEVLTDSIINEPVRKATDKLFGLNVFEIDPIISGERLNPSARLTVGRQINNNLRVTYATNLSQDQNQVLALEYRVSNKLSVIAQYEQRSLSNVTRNRDNFSLEVRFRRRF